MSDWLESHTALTEQYEDATNLNARIALHETYSTAEIDLQQWQFNQFDYMDDADILAVGCGPADLWAENCKRIPAGWSVTLTDFSAGMVDEARGNLTDCISTFAFGVADAATLPFDDNSFGAITANHMLYHLPDRDAALAELRRVVRPDGTVYATTNSIQHMVEVYDVLETVLGERPSRTTAFTLENGQTQLEQHFSEVEVRRHDNGLVVTEPDPLVAYALSRDDVDDALAPDIHEAFRARFENDEFRVTKDVGMFVASP